MKDSIDKNKIQSLLDQVGELIDARRYKDTITLLRRRLGEFPVAGCMSRLNQAESTYRYLLQYFARGAEDPGRDRLLADIRSSLLDIAEKYEREVAASDSSGLYFSTLRMLRLRPVDIPSLLDSVVADSASADLSFAAGSYPDTLLAKIEDTDGKLFDAFWVADDIPADIYSDVAARISSGLLPLATSALIVAATGLSLERFYSRNALMMLADVASSGNVPLAARASVNLIIALGRWTRRVADDLRMMQRLESLIEEDNMHVRLRTAVFNLVKTRDTDRVSRKMQKEVIPGLMQFGPDIIKRMKDTLKESSFEDIEGNPEWEELLKNSGLEDKLRELTEMQSDGADVMMAAFSNLKGYPFFRQARNWMLPFSMHHSSLRSLHSIEDNGFSSMLEMNGMMCDSDKYSFAFSLAGMPDMQRNLMMEQMQAQLEQMRGQLDELKSLKEGKEFDDEVIRYCRDLYRFYKLFAKRSEFSDPFSRFVNPMELPVVGRLFDSEADYATFSDFYFKRGYYSDAFPFLERLSEVSGDTPHVWEKIGFCYEKMQKDDNLAIEAYMKAQLFNPDSKWISRRLGLCFRRKGDFRNAVEYLRMSLPSDGAFDFRMALVIVDVLMSDGKWSEALKELYRVDYESPSDAEVLRRMAQCAFRMGDFDSALNRLDSINDVDFSEQDYRMKGHIAFLRRNIPDAISFYRMTVRPNDRRRLWKSNIMADLPALEALGGTRADLLLLLESMAYSLEE